MYYKTCCFAFQKRRFCTVKAALLHCKTAAFANFYLNWLNFNTIGFKNTPRS